MTGEGPNPETSCLSNIHIGMPNVVLVQDNNASSYIIRKTGITQSVQQLATGWTNG